MWNVNFVYFLKVEINLCNIINIFFRLDVYCEDVFKFIRWDD